MIDIDNSFLLFQDAKTNLMYKAPLRALEGMFAVNTEDTKEVEDLKSSIDQLSMIILEVSTLVSADFFSREEVEKKFEMLSSTNAISSDPTILTEKQIPKYPDRHNLIKYENAEAAMINVENEIDKYFANIDRESNSYY